jgi:hypothetical protein
MERSTDISARRFSVRSMRGLPCRVRSGAREDDGKEPGRIVEPIADGLYGNSLVAYFAPPVRSGGLFDLVGTNQKVGWNFPCLPDLVDHLDGKRAPTRKNFRGTRARAQKLCELRLRMPELVDRIPEHIDRIEGLVDFDRPSLCLASAWTECCSGTPWI